MERYIAIGAGVVTLLLLVIYQFMWKRSEPFTSSPNSVGTFDSAMEAVSTKAKQARQSIMAAFGRESFGHEPFGEREMAMARMKTFDKSVWNGSQLPWNAVEPYNFKRKGDGTLEQCQPVPPVFEQFDPSVDPMKNDPRTYVNEMNWNAQRTSNKLSGPRNELMPTIGDEVTPYNIDVADPVAYSFLVTAPRVIIKDRQAMMADPYRGDIPLAIFPDVPVVERPQYGRSGLRYDTLFSGGYAKNQAKYNAAKMSMSAPIHVAQEGINM
jgi:hypothetical protein